MAQTNPPADLAARLEELGREIGAREAPFRDELARARAVAEKLRDRVAEGLDRFQRAAAGAGAPQIHTTVSETRVDDKHVRAVQFDLDPGLHRDALQADAHR